MSFESKVIEIKENINYPSVNNDFTNNNICYFDGSYEEFFNKFLLTNTPCIISNATKGWKCSFSWVIEGKPNINYLNSKYGKATVPVANCNQKYYNSQCKNLMTFSKFAEYWKKFIENGHPSETEPCLYLKDWHFTRDFPNENVYTVPPEFSSDWLNEFFVTNPELNDDYKFVYMGPKGSWTPFHADVFTSYSWSVNICGEKRWILLPPGEEQKLKNNFGVLPYDICDKDCDNFEVKYLLVTQKPGDALFVPSGWHHQVWNMMDTISINHNWINGCNIDKVWTSMKLQLDDVIKEISGFKDSMDNWHEHCQLILKSCFGMDFKDFYTFLKSILKSREQSLQIGQPRRLYGDWITGLNHLKFDLKKVNEVICEFQNNNNLKLLLKEKNVDEFIN